MEGSVITSPRFDSYHCLSFTHVHLSLVSVFDWCPKLPWIWHFPLLHTDYTLLLVYDQFFLLCLVFPLLLFCFISQSPIYSSSQVLLSCHVKHFLAISSIIYLFFPPTTVAILTFTHYCLFINLSSFLSRSPVAQKCILWRRVLAWLPLVTL